MGFFFCQCGLSLDFHGFHLNSRLRVKTPKMKIFEIPGIQPMYNKFRNWLLNFTAVYKNEFLIFSIRFRLKTRYIGAINLIETQS